MTLSRLLLLGYGNPGRLDDALGPACAAMIEKEHLPGLSVESQYQLCVEDSAYVATMNTVIFVDASIDGPEPYALTPLSPAQRCSFTSHILDPETLLYITRDLFGATPEAYLLQIRGYEFNEFDERLSEKAKKNLEEATAFVRDFVLDRVGAYEERR